MTDEEKKEYRDKLVEDCMKYNHIDYDDDKDIVETMVEAIASEELMELIPNFDPYNLTARQRVQEICCTHGEKRFGQNNGCTVFQQKNYSRDIRKQDVSR